jgi:ABC-type microcin C transport system permease subunit YejE
MYGSSISPMRSCTGVWTGRRVEYMGSISGFLPFQTDRKIANYVQPDPRPSSARKQTIAVFPADRRDIDTATILGLRLQVLFGLHSSTSQPIEKGADHENNQKTDG